MHPNDQHQKLYDKYQQQQGSHENLLNILIKKGSLIHYNIFYFLFHLRERLENNHKPPTHRIFFSINTVRVQ